MLEKFNLNEKEHTLAANLSGGQKRKLQLATALLGDSKLILLDEPSSGMDPTARRETWEIIKEAKQDKIIILTTHYMDEAEMLADRVAILSRGSLKTCGTTFFLKQKYGVGYNIEIDELEDCESSAKEKLDQLIRSQLEEKDRESILDDSTNDKQQVAGNDDYQILQNE